MKRHLSSLVLILPPLLSAQEPATPTAPADPTAAAVAATLKPEQIANVLKQLEELEKSALNQRGSTLGGMIQKIRSAASSDAAALGLIRDCDELVNVTRKSNDREAKEEAERRAEAQKRREENREQDDVEKQGDPVLALRLALEYLALSLEANESKDLALMVPKLGGYHKSLIASASKLKGESGEMLMRPIGAERGGRSVGIVVAAFQLEPYLSQSDWPSRPGDILEHYEKVMLKLARQDHKDKVGELWETAITMEGSFRKERLFEGEFAIWSEQAVPTLRWRRAQDLLAHSSTPVTGLSEMLAVIKANPHHASAPQWIIELRSYVAPKTETPATGS
jgi:hypothetical protein